MSDQPELRSGPPWVMEEMIAAEPDLATRICDPPATGIGAVAGAIEEVVHLGQPAAVVGCGTSEHAAMAVAYLLGQALPGAVIASRQAFEAALDPWSSGLCLAISHEGETAATLDALRSAASAGAATALITAAPGSAGARSVDHAVVTPLVDRSWCHTVGYLSPIVAAGAIASSLAGWSLDGPALGARLRRLLELREEAFAMGRPLATISRLVIVGSGLDRIAARELALKVEEGARRPAVGRDMETQLHGHLASADADCGLVAIVIDPSARRRRAARMERLLRACRRVGMPTAAIVTPDVDASWPRDLTSGGRMVVPDAEDGDVPSSLLALTDAAIALQLLTLGVADGAGTNPDLIRREEAAYREAAALAEGP